MPGTKAGAAKAKQAILNRYGEDYYSKIGKVGGLQPTKGGFKNKELARSAGRKGGIISAERKRQKNMVDNQA